MRVLALSLCGFIVCGSSGCGIPQEQYDADMASLMAEVDKANQETKDTATALSSMRNKNKDLEVELTTLKADLARLANENSRQSALAKQAKERLETYSTILKRFRSMVESGKLKIKIVDNKMLVEMASAILFDSGSAELSEEGKVAIAEVASILADIPSRSFQVAGHTDNVPINNYRFKSNWDLSSARAVSVVKHLIENGMALENVSAAGYAETHPVASNDSDAGRAQNRRIEIVMLPKLDELPDLSSLKNMVK